MNEKANRRKPPGQLPPCNLDNFFAVSLLSHFVFGPFSLSSACSNFSAERIRREPYSQRHLKTSCCQVIRCYQVIIIRLSGVGRPVGVAIPRSPAIRLQAASGAAPGAMPTQPTGRGSLLTPSSPSDALRNPWGEKNLRQITLWEIGP